MHQGTSGHRSPAPVLFAGQGLVGAQSIASAIYHVEPKLTMNRRMSIHLGMVIDVNDPCSGQHDQQAECGCTLALAKMLKRWRPSGTVDNANLSAWTEGRSP